MKSTTYKVEALIHDYWYDGVEYHVYYTLLNDKDRDILMATARELSSDADLILTTADSIKKPVIAVAKGEKALLELQLRECPYTNDIEANVIGVYPHEVSLPSFSPRQVCNWL